MQASIAERIAYGTPLDPAEEGMRAHTVERSWSALVGRILLSGVFLTSGFAKFADPEGSIGYMRSAGIPAADILAYVAGVAEVLGGLALLLGFLARLGALGLFIMLIPTTLVFHNFWALSGQEAQMQLSHFMKNLAIMGGLLTLFAHGPGRLSIDARLRRPLAP